ncbi:LamG domain-containing protein [Nocardioides sp. AX2bis]|uniref:LamG domain-containing protein n=1 Tax=Nocardioides sp. AX2bis TaxID=2653157 RepID=UPI0012EEF002|nr:LamG domain-containing protein [Nocardioides sp. AX2bis]VXC10318.1 Concanavalin A-like lectin/glucanase superfamily protein [Nocardioides sp. AX2bis]
MSARTAGGQRRTVLLAVAALALALVAAVAAPSTFGGFVTSVTNQTNTASSAVFGRPSTCQVATNVGSPFFIYPMNEASGTAVADTSNPSRPGTYRGSPIAYRQDGPCGGDAGTGVTINAPVTTNTGRAFLSGPTQTQINPGTFSAGIWFKTNSQRGGRLIGFGNGTGTTESGSYDRHLYLTNAGKVVFGVYPNAVRTVESSTGLNNNTWHYAVGTLSSTTGLRLYIDGALVDSDASVTSAQNYTGQWRIGWDNLASWTEIPASEYYQGSLAWAAVHTTALTPTQVQAIWAAGR